MAREIKKNKEVCDKGRKRPRPKARLDVFLRKEERTRGNRD
jgi:hypothetical protein